MNMHMMPVLDMLGGLLPSMRGRPGHQERITRYQVVLLVLTTFNAIQIDSYSVTTSGP